jgi:DNA-binding transcriptional MerR regulator
VSASSLSIQEAAAATGVSTHTLRYYERIGLLAPIARDANGRRRYHPQDLGAVNILLRLRNTGMPIQGMKRFAALLSRGDAAIPERLELLERHGSSVREQIRELQLNLEAIDVKIGLYQNKLAATPATIPPRDPARASTPEV